MSRADQELEAVNIHASRCTFAPAAVITYHILTSYRRKSVVNLLVEIQNTFVFPAHRLFRPPKREDKIQNSRFGPIQIDLFSCVVDFSVGNRTIRSPVGCKYRTCFAQITRVAFFPYGACTTLPFDLACVPIRSRSDSIEAFL